MKKMSKVIAATTMTAMMVSFVFTGCGTDTMNDATGPDTTTEIQTEDTTTTDGTENMTTEGMTGDNNVGNTTGDGVVGDVANDVGNAAGDVANGVGNAVGDVTRGVGEAVDDMTNGVGNTISGGFHSYEDAHDYLLSQLGTQDKEAAYEIRNVQKETVTYQNGNKGYRFEVHDTKSSKDKKVGVFYVDQETGKVYKEGKNENDITEYKFS